MTTAQLTASIGTRDLGSAAPLRNYPARFRLLVAHILSVAAKQRSRRRLAELDAHLLADIGISREQALRESRKRFWE